MLDEIGVLTLYHWVSASTILTELTLLLAQDGIVLLPLVLAALWFLPRRGAPERRQVLIACGVSLAVALVLVGVMSLLFDRPRPFVALGIPPLVPHEADSSFPSDHTLVGVALVGPLLWLRPRIGGWLMLWAVLVGVARVAAAIHYPTDIVGSALIATFPTVLGVRLTPPGLARLPAIRWLLTVG
jgi:undecaprenyl-diphosphatase